MEIEKHSPKWLLNEIRNAESDAHALFKIIEFQKALTEQCNIADVSGSYVVFEDGADEGVEGMIQLSIPFKTLEEAQAYASSWRSRKTYVAKMIE
jgi:hypothetical protein